MRTACHRSLSLHWSILPAVGVLVLPYPLLKVPRAISSMLLVLCVSTKTHRGRPGSLTTRLQQTHAFNHRSANATPNHFPRQVSTYLVLLGTLTPFHTCFSVRLSPVHGSFPRWPCRLNMWCLGVVMPAAMWPRSLQQKALKRASLQ